MLPAGRSVIFGLACLALCLCADPAMASDATDAAIARQARQALDDATTSTGPGAAVLIARGDTILFRGARGRASIELGVPLAPGQVFRIASVTKMFTAALVLKLAEARLLSLDAPLSDQLPDFPNAGQLTIRHLLQHTAGISDKAVDPQPGFSRRDVETATLVSEIAKRPLNFAPGTSQAYSNAGYILLGAVIEKVTGKPWHAAMAEQLLAPLGLKHTEYDLVAAIIPGRAAGYTSDNTQHAVRNAGFISMSIPAAAGALVSTLDDLHRWMRALASGRVVDADSYRQMIAPATVTGAPPRHPYGMGMYVWQVRGETMVGHTGQVNGFASVLAYLPSRDITIVALANDDNFDARTFGRRLAAIALEQPYPMPVAGPANANGMQELAGTYQRDGAVAQRISVRDGNLYAQRGDRKPVPLVMTAGGHLHFVPDELSYFAPVRDAAGAVVRLDYFENGDGPAEPWPRVQ